MFDSLLFTETLIISNWMERGNWIKVNYKGNKDSMRRRLKPACIMKKMNVYCVPNSLPDNSSQYSLSSATLGPQLNKFYYIYLIFALL